MGTDESGLDARPGILRVPGWEAFSWMRAGFSTRRGGQSFVYGEGEQNLGWTAEDDPAIVAGNRQRFVKAVAEGAELSLVTVHQVHGEVIRDLEVEAPPLMEGDGRARLRGDGMLSRTPGRLLAVLTADCVPVLVADTRLRAVAAFHAGWRGTLARIVERGVESLRDRYRSRPEDLVAAIGPCIGECCYSVGDEVRSGFEREFPYTAELFSEVGMGERRQIRVKLAEANRRQLLDAGLGSEQISMLAECTACSRLPDGRRKFYSHREERGFAGRMLSAIGVVPE